MRSRAAERLLERLEEANRKAEFWEAEAKRQERWAEVYSAKLGECLQTCGAYVRRADERVEELEAQLAEANNMISEMP